MPDPTIQEVHSLVTELRNSFETEFKGRKLETEKASIDLKAKEEKIWARLDQIETRQNRLGLPGEQKAEPTVHHKALMKWLRKGEGALEPEERKVLTIGDSTQTGYMASPEITNELIKGVVLFSPLRSVARVRTTSKNSVQIRKRTGSFSAGWVSEIGTRAETTGYKVGLDEMPTHEMYALVNVSNQDLEDSDFNLEAELNLEFAEQFGVAEGTAFISGSAVGKPEGILINPTIVANVVAGDTNADLSVTDILNAYYGLPEFYVAGSSWLMRRATMKKVVLFKDSSDHYLWMPSLADKMPATLIGQPIVQCPDMPAVASNALAVAIGDFRRGYYIADRIQVEILRDPYTSKKSGQVEISARKRIGGQVVLPEAISVIKCHVT
jgi:HK97 family phage major capsid protein